LSTLLLSIVLAALVGWSGAQHPTSGSGTRAAAVRFADLQNFTYSLGENSSVADGKVPLSNGRWTDPRSGNRYALLGVHAIGDLNRDGVADAVAVVTEHSGETGVFSYLFAIEPSPAGPAQLGEPEWLGDGTVVQRLQIDRNGVITVRYLTHREGDAACCPTMKIEDRFRVEHRRLRGIVK